MTALTFFVAGEAQPQGSAKAFVIPGTSRAVVTSDNSGLKGWRLRIATEAQRAMESTRAPVYDRETPISLTLAFVFLKPKSTPKRVTQHVRLPDLDKLVRAAGDALTHVLWVDDAQVCELVARKGYGPTPGVHVTVAPVHASTVVDLAQQFEVLPVLKRYLF